MITIHIDEVHIHLEDGGDIMAKLADIKAAVAGLTTAGMHLADVVGNLAGDIQGLKDQIAAGSPVTQADLDALGQDVQGAVDALAAAVTAAEDLDAETP